MTCELAHQDAAYVLGALSPGERSEYQRHLAGCDECSRSVRMLAGMPGLLARVPEDVLDVARTDDDPVPSTLLPALVEEVRRRGKRRTWLVSGLAAAAAVAVIAGSVVLGNVLSGDQQAPSAGPSASPPSVAPATPMYPVRPLPVTAEVSLTSVSWGTRLDLTCTYEEPKDGHEGRSWRYALVVETRDGEAEQVATWVAKPGKTFDITGATASPKSEIAAVEVQTPEGETLLRLHT
ncbi:MAG TPA: zf-HC2 domain-containing protein [Nocardioides sp.]|uniref:anti-sigma factor family protein n=1 Tax=Nocardioides sp. TaxID=35761 RepID=UPI002D805CF8|nr:zf-HC2 domain-containing protein [Nocardioides sp.]HET6653196.1 zf-HC2 domain-containing protein [Nocardioides sp.]